MELSGHCELLLGRDATECHVRAFVVVSPEPLSGGILNTSNAFEQILAEPVGSHGSVVALDVGILLRLAGLGIRGQYT